MDAVHRGLSDVYLVSSIQNQKIKFQGLSHPPVGSFSLHGLNLSVSIVPFEQNYGALIAPLSMFYMHFAFHSWHIWLGKNIKANNAITYHDNIWHILEVAVKKPGVIS